jgi:hypothetical protein
MGAPGPRTPLADVAAGLPTLADLNASGSKRRNLVTRREANFSPQEQIPVEVGSEAISLAWASFPRSSSEEVDHWLEPSALTHSDGATSSLSFCMI